MTGKKNHTALIPSEDIVKEAGKRVSAKAARKGEPLLHMTEDMRRLSTPWSISMIRAEQIESFDLHPQSCCPGSRTAVHSWTCMKRYRRP